MAQKFPVKVVVAGTSLGEFQAADFVGVDDGGTGAITAPAALSNLGAEASANKGNPNGYPSLDGGGKIPVSQIPATALPEVHVVADAAARLALVVQEGDEAIQLDDGSHWIYDGTTWYERPQPITFPLEIKDGGVSQTLAAKVLNFIGFTITEPSADEIDIQAPAGGGSSSLIVQTSENSKEAAYKIMTSMIWPGSTDKGTPTSIKSVVYVDDAGDDGEIKIFDVTNGLQIAEVTGITAVDLDNVLDFGTLTNISTGEAVWEFQGRVTGGGKNSKLFLEGTVIYI